MSLISEPRVATDTSVLLHRRLGHSEEKEASRSSRVKSVCKARIQDPSTELQRLADHGLIDQATAQRVRKHLHRYGPVQGKKLEALLGRALGIQNLYRESHDVFVHAQASGWRSYSDLIKELMKLRHPEKDFHQFQFLRLPKEDTPYGIGQYSQSYQTCDNSPKTANDLISADSYLFNDEPLESALCFLNSNSSCNFESDVAIQHFSKEVLSSLYPKMTSEALEAYAQRITNIHSSKTETTGNLFVFCIPKKVSDQVQYRSHAFGVPCKQCHPDRSDREILDELQQGILNNNNDCAYFNNHQGIHAPQARIFTPALTKENGIEVYLLVADKDKRKAEKELVRELAREIHTQFRPTRKPPCTIL